MRINVLALISCFTLFLCTHVPLYVQAEQVEKVTDLLAKEYEQPVDARIISLLERGKFDFNAIESTLAKIESSRTDFNDAEQTLIFYIKGDIAYQRADFEQAVSWLELALKAEGPLLTKQLFTKYFVEVPLRLAQSLAELGQFEKAYIERRKYRRRLYEYLQVSEQERISELDKIYETKHKAAENELLIQEKKVKDLQLEEETRKQNKKQFNMIVLVATLFVFVVLLVRQLTLRRKLTYLSRTDALTRLLNRRSLFYYGEKLFDEAKQQQHALSVILIDIDHFKRVNDQYGHSAGDEVIKMLAKLGEETVRARDRFARMGGEEFLAILPHAGLGEAKAIAERLREKISDISFESLGFDAPITVSIGVASLHEDMHIFDELVNVADAAMYHAKSNGRNQVCEPQMK